MIKKIDTTYNLNRFLEAQESSYEIALSEIRNGRKESHWMWYIFPQIKGLGHSETAKFYAIADIEEAEQYLNHDVLGKRSVEISNELLKLDENNATKILGSPDDMKLKSSMTLFSEVEGADPVFEKVLEKFYNGEKDEKTLNLLNNDL